MKSVRQLLIVDDNPGDVGLACEALKQCAPGCQIHSVEDGVEALAFLNRRDKYANAARPDLVILDLNLPKRDGLSVLAAMKAGPSCAASRSSSSAPRSSGRILREATNSEPIAMCASREI